MKQKIKIQVQELSLAEFYAFLDVVEKNYFKKTGQKATNSQIEFFKIYCLQMDPDIEFEFEE